MEDEGLRLAARYGYITNSLGYCGPAGTARNLYEFVLSGKGSAEARASLERFEALYPYLCLIADRHGREPFDEEVVRAHFTGTPSLNGNWREELSGLIRNTFSKRGLPQSIANRLADRVPKGAVPHHTFHVLFIHTITGSVPATRATENNCIPSVGKVIDSQTVLRRFIEKDGKLGKPRAHPIQPIDEKFLGAKIRKGDLVALHWDFAVERLTKARAETLLKYTRKNLKAVVN
jgi:hypothetical protein